MARVRIALGLLLVLGLSLAVSGIAVAEEAKCEGTIAKIEGNSVTVKATDGKERVLDVSPATQVKLDNEPTKSSDLKVGQKVKRTCDKTGDKLTCRVNEASSSWRVRRGGCSLARGADRTSEDTASRWH